MQHMYKLIGQVVASDARVLVRGESATGKELVVNAIHFNSARAKGPYSYVLTITDDHSKVDWSKEKTRETGQEQEVHPSGGNLRV